MSLIKRQIQFKKQKVIRKILGINIGKNFLIWFIKITHVIILKKNIKNKVITFYKTKIKKQEKFFV